MRSCWLQSNTRPRRARPCNVRSSTLGGGQTRSACDTSSLRPPHLFQARHTSHGRRLRWCSTFPREFHHRVCVLSADHCAALVLHVGRAVAQRLFGALQLSAKVRGVLEARHAACAVRAGCHAPLRLQHRHSNGLGGSAREAARRRRRVAGARNHLSRARVACQPCAARREAWSALNQSVVYGQRWFAQCGAWGRALGVDGVRIVLASDEALGMAHRYEEIARRVKLQRPRRQRVVQRARTGRGLGAPRLQRRGRWLPLRCGASDGATARRRSQRSRVRRSSRRERAHAAAGGPPRAAACGRPRLWQQRLLRASGRCG